MEAGSTASVPPNGGPPLRGGYRGRGMGGPPMRGGFDRGRGRGMGRGYYMGGLGRGGVPVGMGGPPPPNMMTGGRGMRAPRGVGYQGRGFVPRSAPSMRGGRPPMYAQQPKQHTGAENNKTVSPVPATTSNANTAETTAENVSTQPTTGSSTNGAASTAASDASVSSAAAASTNGADNGGGGGHVMTRMPRGRGLGYGRGGGRGGYNPHANGGMHVTGGYGMGGGYGEHGQMSIRRGGPPRGRGSYGQSMSRSPMHQHSANTQIAPVSSLKRGAPGGPPGPKRGRFESGGPYTQRPMPPKYHQQHVQSMPPQVSYGAPPNHHQAPSHHSYVHHEQTQAVDPYAQSYGAAAAPSSYNGYAQSGGYAMNTAPTPQVSTTYATEYDQTQYQSYNSAYATQQDTRYQTYGQDYTQQYGAPAVDYSSSTQGDYSQHAQQGYEDRYASYDSQAYQQGYSNTTGYY